MVKQLSHLRGSSVTIWLLDKGMEEIQTSTRAVHILLVSWKQGWWSLSQPALQAVNSCLLLGPGIWGEKGKLVRGVCSAAHCLPRDQGLSATSLVQALQGPLCTEPSTQTRTRARGQEKHNSAAMREMPTCLCLASYCLKYLTQFH